MTEITIYNVKRAVTPEAGIGELLVLSSACCPKVLFCFVKFHENSLNGFLQNGHENVMEITYLWCSKGCNSNSK